MTPEPDNLAVVAASEHPSAAWAASTYARLEEYPADPEAIEAAWTAHKAGDQSGWQTLAAAWTREGRGWRQILEQLGLDRDTDDDGTVENYRELVKRLKNQAATITHQAAVIVDLQARVARLTAELTAAKGRAAPSRRRVKIR